MTKLTFSFRTPAMLLLSLLLFALAIPGAMGQRQNPASGALLAPAPGSPLPISARAMAAADLNGDRRADLVLCTETTLQIFLGSAARRWTAKPDLAIELPIKNSDIVITDINNDRIHDILLADHDSYDVTVMLGAGDGRFQAAAGSPYAARKGAHPHTHGLAVADLNHDGHPDLVTANNSDGDLSVLLGDGKGGFSPADGSPFACGPSPYPFALADIDGDGHLDALVPNSSPGVKTLTILKGDGAGRFAPAANSPLQCRTTARWVTCGDLNGDRLPDVLATHDDTPEEGRFLTILLNQGKGQLRPAPASPLPIDDFAWGVEIADMDRDGKADLVVGANNAVRVFLGDGSGGFRPAPGSPFRTGKGAWRVTVADFNGDGRLDVATRCIDANHLEILYGQLN